MPEFRRLYREERPHWRHARRVLVRAALSQAAPGRLQPDSRATVLTYPFSGGVVRSNSNDQNGTLHGPHQATSNDVMEHTRSVPATLLSLNFEATELMTSVPRSADVGVHFAEWLEFSSDKPVLIGIDAL